MLKTISLKIVGISVFLLCSFLGTVALPKAYASVFSGDGSTYSCDTSQNMFCSTDPTCGTVPNYIPNSNYTCANGETCCTATQPLPCGQDPGSICSDGGCPAGTFANPWYTCGPQSSIACCTPNECSPYQNPPPPDSVCSEGGCPNGTYDITATYGNCNPYQSGFYCCAPLPKCTSGPYTNLGVCHNAPANTCGPNNGIQSATANGPSQCYPSTVTIGCQQPNCSAGYVCTNNTTCTTSITVHVYKDYNHDGIVNGNDAGLAGITITDNGGNFPTTDNTGTTVFTQKPTGTYTMTMTVPAGYQAVGATSQQVTLTNNSGNAVVNFYLTPLYTISGTVFSDGDLNSCYNPPNKACTWNGTYFAADPFSKDSPYTNGSHMTITGPVNTAVNADGSGNYTTTQTLTSGSYTVTYDTSTTPLPSGYRFKTPKSYTITLGDTVDNQAGFICNIGGSSDTTNTLCTIPNNGSIVGLNFGVTNETSWTTSVCGDIRYNSGYSQPIPATANCNNTVTPNAINSASYCTTNPGIVFSGSTDPSYGQGTGPSTSQMQVGNASFPENFASQNPNAIDTKYSLVYASTSNLTTPAILLSSVCPDLSNCDIKNLAGGTYTTTAADGPVTLSVSGDNTLNANYTFVIGGNLTVASKVLLTSGYSATFVSGGDIHIAGSVGESNWNSTTIDLQGLFSADGNFDIDRVTGLIAACNTNGQPVDNKLNIDGVVIPNAAGAGGAIVNNREGCTQDLQCPTTVFQSDALQMLHSSSLLRTPLNVWKELNP